MTQRAVSRGQRLAVGILTAALSRGSAVLAPFALIYTLLPAMGEQTFGGWLTITSLTGMLIWADLGLGNGLLTQLSRSLSDGDRARAQRQIATAYVMVSLVGLTILIGVALSLLILDWESVLGLPGDLATEARILAMVCMGVFACNVPLSLIQRVQYAADQVSRNNLITAIGPMLSLTFGSWAAYEGASLILLVLGATIGPVIANMAASIIFFRANRDLLPSIRAVQRDHALPLLRLGGAFLVISTMSAIAYNLDNLIIAQVRGAAAVTDFGVSARMLAALGMLVTVVNQPLWPANARALAAREFDWVRKTTFRMMTLSGLSVLVASLILIAAAPTLLGILTQGTQAADYVLLCSLASWWLIVSATSPLSMVQNAAGRLRPQLVGWTVFLLVTATAKYLVVVEIGVELVPLAGSIAYLVTVLPALIIGYRKSVVSDSA